MLNLPFDGEDVSQTAVPGDTKSMAQGVQCGEFLLAFPFQWARQIIEQFELVPVPRAPSWMLGAVNVNGLIVPVVDMTKYFSQSVVPAQLERGQRLLLGGLQVAAEDRGFAERLHDLNEWVQRSLSGLTDIISVAFFQTRPPAATEKAAPAAEPAPTAPETEKAGSQKQDQRQS